jgi:peptidoglycan/LPS O-acetylase OafA/YrhL
VQGTGVFGSYRWFLATMVVMSHLAPEDYSGCGYYAVFGFFALSGYLMTHVLKEHYLKQPKGILRYLANRALRIYPLYWLVAMFGFAMIYWLPDIAKEVHPFMVMPDHPLHWTANSTLFGIVLDYGTRIKSIFVPPAWSLSIEMVMYLLLPFVVRNGFVWVWWIGMCLAFTGAHLIEGQGFYVRYFSYSGGMMPFALGSALYLVKNKLPTLPHAAGVLLLVLLATLNLFSWPIMGERVLTEGFYVMFALNLLAIHYLSRITINQHSRFARVDAWLGGIAYPIFLVHVPLAVAIKATIATGMTVKSFPFFFLCLPFVYAVSWLLHAGVEKRINRLRARIRSAS